MLVLLASMVYLFPIRYLQYRSAWAAQPVMRMILEADGQGWSWLNDLLAICILATTPLLGKWLSAKTPAFWDTMCAWTMAAGMIVFLGVLILTNGGDHAYAYVMLIICEFALLRISMEGPGFIIRGD